MQSNLSASSEAGSIETDWESTFKHAYSRSLGTEPGVPHGRLVDSLQETTHISGNEAAAEVIKKATTAGKLQHSSGQHGPVYELVSDEGAGEPADAIPKELREAKQWVCWRYQDRSGGKPAKIPLDAKTGRRASTSDAQTWNTYQNAKRCSEADGIGFVFATDDPFVGVDLDDCVRSDGTIEDWAIDIVAELSSYAEYSPSGTGLHIIVRGNMPGDNNRRGNVEMYEDSRYFTVTGNRLGKAPTSIEPNQAGLDRIYGEYLDEGSSTKSTNESDGTKVGSAHPLSESDEKLLEKAKNSKGGVKFKRLWEGDITHYDSHSEADSALCSKLAFWTGGDTERIDRLFRKSGLMRPKWDEARGDRTYGEQTIENAQKVVTNHYNPQYMSTDYNSNYRNYPAQDQDADSEDAETTPAIAIEDVQDVIIEEFDEATWYAAEAVLSAHATLLLEGSTGTGFVLVGPSSSGKTTVLEFFEGLEDMVYRSDDVTPASFVSHDASKGDDELSDIDLIPKIKQKTLLSRDMATWFAGEQEDIHKRMSVMTNLLDGQGYTRDTGTHGTRGYTGREYRFNFIGATTPLSPRAWHVMGNVGTRLVFYERRGETDVQNVVEDLLDGTNYHEKVATVQSTVEQFLKQIWDETGGFASISERSIPPAGNREREFLKYLIDVVRHSRAIINEDSVQMEGGHRIGATLRDMAQARAVLDGREAFTLEDMQVSARVALSTMPRKRRLLVQSLLNPANDGMLRANDVEQAMGVSRPTAHSRMELLDTLGIGKYQKNDDAHRLKVQTKFEWPDGVAFPSFYE